uniref:No apical meristem-associated C-terminal domain-containing protein n=1 Tax=Brassica oleracea var. oleracea TaxID=109376 RepID=A0A0D3EBJ6_BRAOL
MHSERFSNLFGVEYTSLESDNLNLDSPTQASPRLSSSSLNLNDENENISGSPSSRPLGVKKSKMKQKIVDQTNSIINTLEGGNNQFKEKLKKSSEQRQQHLEI